MSAEPCNTCGGTGVWESTLEDAPTILVDLGPCPDCSGIGPIRLTSTDIYTADEVWNIIVDILVSVQLAELNQRDGDSILPTVTDYVTNQYGIDS